MVFLAMWCWLRQIWPPKQGYDHHCRRKACAYQGASSLLRRSRAKPDWVRKEIIHLKALMPDAGCRSLALVFNRRFAAHSNMAQHMTVGKTFVADVIQRHRYEIAVLRKGIKHRVPPGMPNNTVWAIPPVSG